MAILHYKITQADQNIELPTDIHAQSFILRRIIVQSMPPSSVGMLNSTNKGGVIVQPSHLSGLEIISGDDSNSNDIVVAYDETVATHSIFMDMQFDSETVPRGFNVKVQKFDKNGLAGFSPIDAPVQGTVHSIDVFFEFSSLFNYEGY